MDMTSDGGVANGTRTRDHRDHNPGLYQLSYRHLAVQRIATSGGAYWPPYAPQGPVAQWIERQASNLRAEVRFLPGPLVPAKTLKGHFAGLPILASSGCAPGCRAARSSR